MYFKKFLNCFAIAILVFDWSIVGHTASGDPKKGETVTIRAGRTPEHFRKYALTNPSKLFPIGNGQYLVAIREQKRKEFMEENEPKPGRSQVGLYLATESSMANPSNTNFNFRRLGTALGHQTLWYEDPSLVQIGDKILLGAVWVDPKIVNGLPQYELHQEFFELKVDARRPEKFSISSEPLLVGPPSMKDVRLFEFTDVRTNQKKIGVLTRPKGGEFGSGYIGLAVADDLSQITPDLILHAPSILTPNQLRDLNPIFETYFQKHGDLWLGSNDIIIEKPGIMTVYGHVGTPWKNGESIPGPYAAIRFTLDLTDLQLNPLTGFIDPRTVRVSDATHIAEVKDFGKIKDGNVRPNTVFTGGVLDLHNGTRIGTAGLNDDQWGFLPQANLVPPGCAERMQLH